MKTYELNLKDYCENCPEFEVTVQNSMSYESNYDQISKLRLIGCKHAVRCDKIVNFLNKELLKEKES